jgi:hypothetical protein
MLPTTMLSRNPDIEQIGLYIRQRGHSSSEPIARLSLSTAEILSRFDLTPIALSTAISNPTDNELQCLEQLIQARILVAHNNLLLITGCGRSGTQYIATRLSAIGIDIGHECIGRNGIASWPMAINADQLPWGPSRKNFLFSHCYHQVRHPLAVIESAHTFLDRSWNFILSFIPCKANEPMLVRCAKYWLYWNRFAEENANLTYRIEDIENILPQLLDRLGHSPRTQVGKLPDKNRNTRRDRQNYPAIGWDDLKSADLSLYKAIAEQAEHYGYVL